MLLGTAMHEWACFVFGGGETHAKTRHIKTTKFKLNNTIQPYTTDYSLWNPPHDIYLWDHMVGPPRQGLSPPGNRLSYQGTVHNSNAPRGLCCHYGLVHIPEQKLEEMTLETDKIHIY